MIPMYVDIFTFGMLPGQLAHQSTLAHRWKPYEADTSNSCPGNIKASCMDNKHFEAQNECTLLTAPASST